ncbi:MAG TPA: rRNA maturation RNase YbeY [Candidatus Methylomirabilis sp.]|nr:rRNA maturation RNase YbeY [Candidatus Methylomirabilis sp.]
MGCPEAEVGCLLVTDRRIRALNRRYRGEDAPTDVLAFPQAEGGGPPGQPGLLGDVVISVETAARQAARAGHSLEREAALLLIHGILHLLGHDHATAVARRRMWALQRRLLRGAAAGLRSPRAGSRPRRPPPDPPTGSARRKSAAGSPRR